MDGITYMGTPGWTQTSYGSLIPPPGVSFSSLGFTLSDGNTYPMVVMDEDGVLQFGFTSGGTVSGASAPGNDYIILESQSTTVLDMGVRRVSGTSLSFNGAFDRIDINVSGLYLVSWFIPLIVNNSSGTAYFRLQWNGLSEEIRTNHDVHNNTGGVSLPGSGDQHFSGSIPLYLTSGDQLDYSIIGSSVIGHSPGANIAIISAVKLGGV